MNTTCGLTLCILLSVTAPASRAATPQLATSDITEMIGRAGNAEDELVRYRILREVIAIKDLDATLRQDLEDILGLVDYWANNTYRPPEPRRRAAENGFLCGFFTGKVSPDRHLLPRVAEDSPLYPIYCLYRGRMLIHQVIHVGPIACCRSPAIT